MRISGAHAEAPLIRPPYRQRPLEQLRPGRMLLPLGAKEAQALTVVEGRHGQVKRRALLPVRFSRLETMP